MLVQLLSIIITFVWYTKKLIPQWLKLNQNVVLNVGTVTFRNNNVCLVHQKINPPVVEVESKCCFRAVF
jgi:hypothetical protein